MAASSMPEKVGGTLDRLHRRVCQMQIPAAAAVARRGNHGGSHDCAAVAATEARPSIMSSCDRPDPRCRSAARRFLTMRQRTFGRTGWQVGEVGYGMWGMGGWSGSDDAESLASLELAVGHGVNCFD